VTERFSVSQRFAAGQLLAAPSDWPEDRLRQELGRLLDGFGIENVLTYATEAGPADLIPAAAAAVRGDTELSGWISTVPFTLNVRIRGLDAHRRT